MNVNFVLGHDVDRSFREILEIRASVLEEHDDTGRAALGKGQALRGATPQTTFALIASAPESMMSTMPLAPIVSEFVPAPLVIVSPPRSVPVKTMPSTV
jgi:hypothetical protein